MRIKAIAAMVLLACTAPLVQAQTASPPLDLKVPVDQPAAVAGDASAPGQYYGDISGDDVDKSVQVHGSFTTGIGYSKGYGTSTMNAAELDVSKQTDDGKSLHLHIDVSQSRGLGGGYQNWNYGPRYRGY